MPGRDYFCVFGFAGDAARACVAAGALAVAAGCGHRGDSGGADGGAGATYASHDALVDPVTCKACHADHYRDWSGSMHAYAADDPVFLAMNARGQRETGGALGDFCVRCHAPMAAREGWTKNGLDLANVPQRLKGVTCFFCHSVDGVDLDGGASDDPLHLAADGVMRGPFTDPVANTTHAAAYSTLVDRDHLASAPVCGACHDIVNGHGVAIERTFQEWKGTVYDAVSGQTCAHCHMSQSQYDVPIAQAPGVFSRRYHGHDFAGADLALTPFAEADAQKAAVADFLDNRTLFSQLCVGEGTGGIQVVLENVGAGHGWPSGASQDRRVWIEVVAYAGDKVLYQSGVVPDGTPVTKISDPDLWLLRDCMLDAQDRPVPMFWQAEHPSESHELPGTTTLDASDPAFYATHVYKLYQPGVVPDRVTMRVRMQPVGRDVLDDLVASGDLDARIAAAAPTFDIGGAGDKALLTWTPEAGVYRYSFANLRFTCVTNSGFTTPCQPDQLDSCVAAPAHTHCLP